MLRTKTIGYHNEKGRDGGGLMASDRLGAKAAPGWKGAGRDQRVKARRTRTEKGSGILWNGARPTGGVHGRIAGVPAQREGRARCDGKGAAPQSEAGGTGRRKHGAPTLIESASTGPTGEFMVASPPPQRNAKAARKEKPKRAA
jgi:hypothetical protein